MTTTTTAPLTPADVAGLLQAMLATVQAEINALPAAVAGWHPAAGEWCVQETLGHMIESERRGFSGRIRTILSADHPFLPGWNQVAVAAERRDCEQPIGDVLAEFSGLRRASIAQVEALSLADLERAGDHEQVGVLSVRDLLHEWVHHDRNHVRQMLENVQSYAWPYMANAQLFTTAHP